MRVRKNCFKGLKTQCNSGLNSKEVSYIKVQVWVFHSYQGPGSIHLVMLSSSTDTFYLVIQMTPSAFSFHIPTSRKGKERATLPFVKAWLISHWPKSSHIAAREAGKDPYSFPTYSAKPENLITEEENIYWVIISSFLFMCLDHRMQQEENKVREVGRYQIVGVLCTLC